MKQATCQSLCRILSLLVLSTFHALTAWAQPGTLDHSFNPSDVGFSQGDGPNSFVVTTALQPDGKLLIGGLFWAYNGQSSKSIARLSVDGRLDTSFAVGSGANDAVWAIAVQTDGKILIGGWFTSYNGQARNRIARLNPDGSLDASFNPGSGANDLVRAIALQPDGKILVAGSFTSYGGVLRNRVTRLNSNGSVDLSFDPGTGANNRVHAVVLQADGKVLIGGEFSSYTNIGRNRIARLNGDGTLDASFDPGTGASDTVSTVALDYNGKILLGGSFMDYNGIACNRIIRLEADGTLDPSFNPGTGANASVFSIAIQSDGKILVGGLFSSFNGNVANRFTRLDVDGSMDSWFTQGSGANNRVLTIALQTDGKILLGGNFTSYNGAGPQRMARLEANGDLDVNFNPVTGANNAIRCIAVQPDGKILIGGQFNNYNGAGLNRIARLLADGSIDPSFAPGDGANDWVRTIVLQPNGKILIGGSFTSYDGINRNRIARLNTDGSLDPSFDPGAGTTNSVHTISLQTDGKILIAGWFTSYDSIARQNIARLDVDGSLDLTFSPGTGTDGEVFTSLIQPDGQILIGGPFTSYDGVARNGIARLNTDGSLDASFDPGPGSYGNSRSLALQPDGKILVGVSAITRLVQDGSVDATFDPGLGVNTPISSIALQPDGKVLIGGAFTYFGFESQKGVARLSTLGALDPSFDPGSGTDTWVASLVLLSSGQVLIGGNFTSYDGIGRNRIARINGDLSTSMNGRPAAPELGLWPNPADQLVHVAFTNGGKGSLRVVDLHGASVLVSPLCSSLPLDGLASGVYVVQALDADDRVVASARLVKD